MGVRKKGLMFAERMIRPTREDAGVVLDQERRRGSLACRENERGSDHRAEKDGSVGG